MTSIQRGFCVGMKVRHFKGAYYEIVGFALNTETNEKMVVYKRLYPPCLLFVRPEEMFCSEVDHKKYPDVKQRYRFERAEDEDETD